MKELNTFFPKILHDASQDPEVAIVFLRELWPQIVGPKVAGRSRPEKLTERTLVLAVLDDTWRRELENVGNPGVGGELLLETSSGREDRDQETFRTAVCPSSRSWGTEGVRVERRSPARRASQQATQRDRVQSYGII